MLFKLNAIDTHGIHIIWIHAISSGGIQTFAIISHVLKLIIIGSLEFWKIALGIVAILP